MKLVLGVGGIGESGKDFFGEIMRDHTTVRYLMGTSAYFSVVAYELWGKCYYKSADECWSDRRNHRKKWASLMDEYNRNDPAQLYKDCLAEQDILSGVRRRHEFQACKDAGLCDLWIWIDRSNAPLDPTQEYGPDDCDITISNNGSKEEFKRKVLALAKTWCVLKEQACTSTALKNC